MKSKATYTRDFTIYSLGKSEIDGSKQYKMIHKDGGEMLFALDGDDLYPHTWICPGKGKLFLEKLEEIAKNWKIKRIIVPNVLNPKLISILENNGYEKKLILDKKFKFYIEAYIKTFEVK